MFRPADHRVWTENRGWVDLGDLQADDRLLRLPACHGEKLRESSCLIGASTFGEQALTTGVSVVSRLSAGGEQCVAPNRVPGDGGGLNARRVPV